MGRCPYALVKRELVHVPEGRRILADITMLENLQLEAFSFCSFIIPSKISIIICVPLNVRYDIPRNTRISVPGRVAAANGPPGKTARRRKSRAAAGVAPAQSVTGPMTLRWRRGERPDAGLSGGANTSWPRGASEPGCRPGPGRPPGPDRWTAPDCPPGPGRRPPAPPGRQTGARAPRPARPRTSSWPGPSHLTRSKSVV